MDNNTNESYARRSKKYNDQSNFGSSEPADTKAEPIPEIPPAKDAYYGISDQYSEEDYVGRKRGTRTTRAEKPESKSKIIIGWIISITVAVAVALLVRAFLFEIIMVDGESMYPTLHTNERVAVEKVSRYFGMPERGDIIIVNYPNMDGTFVKRTIGLPGETVEVKNSTVYINGVALEEDYINKDEPYADMPAVVVPENHIFVMGDNRAHSLDSRTYYIGALSHDAIVGHGLSIIWPFSEFRSIN